MSIEAIISIGLVLFVQLIVIAVGYGKLQQKVGENRCSINELKDNYKAIDSNLDTIGNRLTRIETMLNSSNTGRVNQKGN